MEERRKAYSHSICLPATKVPGAKDVSVPVLTVHRWLGLWLCTRCAAQCRCMGIDARVAGPRKVYAHCLCLPTPKGPGAKDSSVLELPLVTGTLAGQKC